MAEKGISKNRTCAEKEELMEDPLIAIDAFMGILMSVNETVNELLLNAHELQRLKSLHFGQFEGAEKLFKEKMCLFIRTFRLPLIVK